MSDTSGLLTALIEAGKAYDQAWLAYVQADNEFEKAEKEFEKAEYAYIDAKSAANTWRILDNARRIYVRMLRNNTTAWAKRQECSNELRDARDKVIIAGEAYDVANPDGKGITDDQLS